MITRIDVNMDEIDQDNLMAYVKATFKPVDVCREAELEGWAKENGWVDKAEVDGLEEEIAKLTERIEELEKNDV